MKIEVWVVVAVWGIKIEIQNVVWNNEYDRCMTELKRMLFRSNNDSKCTELK